MAEQEVVVLPWPNAAKTDLVEISPRGLSVIDVEPDLVTIYQDVVTTGNVTVGGDLQVDGDGDVDGDLGVLGDLDVTGDVIARNELIDMISATGGLRVELTNAGRVNFYWNAERSDGITTRFVRAGEDAFRMRFHVAGGFSTQWASGSGAAAGDPIVWTPLLVHTSTDITFLGVSLVPLPQTYGFAYGARFNGAGLLAVANGLATNNDTTSGPLTRQAVSEGTIRLVKYVTQTGAANTVMTLLVNGVAMGSFNLTGPDAGHADVAVPVTDDDVVELEWTSGTAPGRSTWGVSMDITP